MEVRPYLTAGAAIVSTGALIAALPAIVPAPTPPDVKISAAGPESMYADVALRFTSQELFNAIFSGFPDTTGPAGAVGVAALLTDGVPLVNDFVTGGVIGVASFLTEGNEGANTFVNEGFMGLAALAVANDPLASAFVEGGVMAVLSALVPDNTLLQDFLDGGIISVASTLTEADPLANAFVNDGVIGVADLLTQDNPLANTFVNGGFVAATESVLVSLTAADPVVQQGIQSFFSGYPFEVDEPGTEDDLPAGPAGIVGLVHYVLDRLAGNIPEEEVLQTGVTGTDTTMLAATQDLPEANAPVNPDAHTLRVNLDSQLTTGAAARGAVAPGGTTDPTTVVETDPTTLEETDPDPTATPVGATTPGTGSGSMPAGQPPVASTTPPTTDPVVDPVDPADPVSNEEDGKDAKQLTEEELNSGNKVTPDPILFQNRSGGGGTAWNQTVQRWKDFGAKLGLGGGAAPAAPAAPSTPDAGGTDGGTDGAS